MGKILLAVREEECSYLVDVLEPDHDLLVCSRISEAMQCLQPQLDLILCSVHFDDGSLFDLAEHCKSDPAMRIIPYYGVVVHNRHFSHYFLQGLRSALNVFTADGVLDLAGLRRDLGEADAIAMMRTAINGIVGRGQRGRRRGSGAGLTALAA